jgi:hypothetical protein
MKGEKNDIKILPIPAFSDCPFYGHGMCCNAKQTTSKSSHQSHNYVEPNMIVAFHSMQERSD